ncbi:MAG: hypothetical protein RCG15_04355 [Candidatus Rickettsia vulgarisii]
MTTSISVIVGAGRDVKLGILLSGVGEIGKIEVTSSKSSNRLIVKTIYSMF